MMIANFLRIKEENLKSSAKRRRTKRELKKKQRNVNAKRN